jgi:tetratricopeptide (TPR) repeat protein
MTTVPHAETGDVVQKHVDRTLGRLATETLTDMRLWIAVVALTVVIVSGLALFALNATPDEKEAFNQSMRWVNDFQFLANGLTSAFKTLSEGSLNLAFAYAILQVTAAVLPAVSTITYPIFLGIRAVSVDETPDQVRQRVGTLLSGITARGATAQAMPPIPDLPRLAANRLFFDPGKGAADAIARMIESAAHDAKAMRVVEGFVRDVGSYRTTGDYSTLLDGLARCGIDGAEQLCLELVAFPQQSIERQKDIPVFQAQKPTFRALTLRSALHLSQGDAEAALDLLKRAQTHAHLYDEKAMSFVLIGQAHFQLIASGAKSQENKASAAADAFQRALDLAIQTPHGDPAWPRAVVDKIFLNARLARLRLALGQHTECLNHCRAFADAIRTVALDGVGEMAAEVIVALRTLRGYLNVYPSGLLADHAKIVLSILDSAGAARDFEVPQADRAYAEFRAHYDLALESNARHESQEAFVAFRKAIRLGNALYAPASNTSEAETMSGLYQEAAVCAQLNHDFWAARDLFKSAIDVLEPYQSRSVRVAGLYLSLGETMAELQDPAGPEAVRTAQRLLTAAAKAGSNIDIEGKNGLWRSHYQLGIMAMRNPSANLAAAHLHFDAARKTAETLTGAQQTDASALNLLSLSRLGLGDCYLAGRRFRDASDAYALAQRAAKQSLDIKDSDDASRALWEAEIKSAEVALALEQIESAERHLRAANAALGGLPRGTKSVPELLTLLRQGELYSARGLTSDALQSYRKCVDDAYLALDAENDPHVWPVMAEAAERLGMTARTMRDHHLRERNQVDPKPAPGRVLVNAHGQANSAPAGAAGPAPGPALQSIRGGKA